MPEQSQSVSVLGGSKSAYFCCIMAFLSATLTIGLGQALGIGIIP